jgi:hypothetical protein
MNNEPGTELTPTRDLNARKPDAPQVSGTGEAAQAVLYRTKDPGAELDLFDLSRRRRATRTLRAQLIGAEYRMKERVRHPDGGESSVAEVIEAEKAQRAQIEREIEHGSRKHRRAPRWIHWIPRYVLCFDYALLLYFFAGITNVDWSTPVSITLGFAMVLAAMVTVLSYGYLAFTGHWLRGYKNHEGTIDRHELDGLTRVIVGVAAVVIAVIATLMYMRMHTEIDYALGVEAGWTAVVIAGALAAVNAAANFLVVAIHALDGSDQVARLERLSAAVRRPVAQAQRLQEQAAHHVEYDQ